MRRAGQKRRDSLRGAGRMGEVGQGQDGVGWVGEDSGSTASKEGRKRAGCRGKEIIYRKQKKKTTQPTQKVSSQHHQEPAASQAARPGARREGPPLPSLG